MPTLNHTFNYKNIICIVLLALGILAIPQAKAATALASSPMLTLKSAPGLVMLTMGRDLPLSRSAYNDVTDIDGDGKIDLYFKEQFKYEGYFAYDRCYSNTTGSVFTPVSYGSEFPVTGSSTAKYYKCAINNAQSTTWSGNFLNWLTMSRYDVLRKVLYGGKRSTDTSSSTVLERSYTPQDSTIWGKEYLSYANDGYYINEHSPLAQPTTATASITYRHLFANATLFAGDTKYEPSSSLNPPQLFVYKNQTNRLWDLVATERPILTAAPVGAPATTVLGRLGPYVVRVDTCILLSGKYEDWCTGYPKGTPNKYKPTGLLHKYGEGSADNPSSLAFGLLSGSYDNNYSGGLLRQNIDDFTREVNQTTGMFQIGSTAQKGIVHHLNELRPIGFGAGSYEWDCGFRFGLLRTNGSCMMWGNPLGEMMFETLRYFAGAPSATPAYTAGVGTTAANRTIDNGATVTSPESTLNLSSNTTWLNPYASVAATARTNAAAYPKCSRPIQMVIGDPKTSFDSDQLPGSFFNNFTASSVNGPNGSLNVGVQADLIWNSEFSTSQNFFIGESGTLSDYNPSAKNVTSFKSIRGHAPDGTTNQGSFYGASVARFGKINGLTNAVTAVGTLNVDQISIALGDAAPKIEIPLNGKIISIVPFSKSVGGCAATVDRTKGLFQTTGEITGFFVEKIANTITPNLAAGILGNKDNTLNGGNPYYSFRISYSDSYQGTDNETDAVVNYIIQQTASNQLTIGLKITYVATCMEMHHGYVISGSSNDGVYLDVGGTVTANATLGYFLDTPQSATATATPYYSASPGTAVGVPNPANSLTIPARLVRDTTANPRSFSSGTSTAGFVPHDMLWYAAKYGSAKLTGSTYEFKLKDSANPKSDPENYYLVSNPSKLSEQMGDAFQKAATLAVATASAVASSGTRVAGGDLVYQAGFDSEKWGGELRAFKVKANGSLEDTPTWRATENLPTMTTRNVILGRGLANKVAINSTTWGALTTAEKAYFSSNESRYKYLLGDRANEKTKGGTLRDRTSSIIDTTNNKPTIGDIVNSDPLYIGKSDFGYSDTDYTAFKGSSEPKFVGVGSNDGHYRLIDATTGTEKLAFIPNAVIENLDKLPNNNYTHQYYVDGPSGFGHVKYGTASQNWHSIVVAGLGAGGKSLFAIDTSPISPATNLTKDNVLWEFTGASSGDGIYIGNILNKPIIGHLNDNDKAVVIVGNGPNSNANHDRASILILNAQTGTLYRSCTPSSSTNNPIGNGMTSIAAVTNATGKIDLIYAADLRGNIWRLDPNVSSSNCGSNAVKVFSALNATGTRQPITGELNVMKAPGGKPGNMILFGTGSYLNRADISNTETQTMYGVWDDTNASNSLLRANLLNYPIINFNAAQLTREVTKKADVNGGKAWYELGTAKGWYIDLTDTGERFIDKVVTYGSGNTASALFLTYSPGTDACLSGGAGWVTGINATTGAYVATFASSAANSAKISGVTPRGLFLSSNAAGKEVFNFTVNYSPNSTSAISPVFSNGGGNTNEGDTDTAGTGDSTVNPPKSNAFDPTKVGTGSVKGDGNCEFFNNCACIPTAENNMCTEPCVPTAANHMCSTTSPTRRQVWRQLQ